MTSPRDVSIPTLLRDRPTFGPFPVPYVTAIIDGKPDFKIHNEARRNECARRKLCQLCGQYMNDRMVFVGTPGSIERRTFGEPPMHAGCAGYAFEVCPWLLGADWRVDPTNYDERVLVATRPEDHSELGIWIATGYRTTLDVHGLLVWSPTDQEGEVEWRTR